MTTHTGGKWTDSTPGLGPAPTLSQRAEHQGGQERRRSERERRRGRDRAPSRVGGAPGTPGTRGAAKSPACPPGSTSESLLQRPFLPCGSGNHGRERGCRALGPEEPKLNVRTSRARGAKSPSLLEVRGRGGRPHDQPGHCGNNEENEA